MNACTLPSLAALVVATAAAVGPGPADAASPAGSARDVRVAEGVGTRDTGAAPPALDRSGKARVGTASVYSRKLVGRRMADGTRMGAEDDNAASRTLPLGTRARITNLQTRQSATVTIQDRGPYAKGRIVDLSPATAEKIGITPRQGIARVEVKPLDLPPSGRDGRD